MEDINVIQSDTVPPAAPSPPAATASQAPAPASAEATPKPAVQPAVSPPSASDTNVPVVENYLSVADEYQIGGSAAPSSNGANARIGTAVPPTPEVPTARAANTMSPPPSPVPGM